MDQKKHFDNSDVLGDMDDFDDLNEFGEADNTSSPEDPSENPAWARIRAIMQLALRRTTVPYLLAAIAIIGCIWLLGYLCGNSIADAQISNLQKENEELRAALTDSMRIDSDTESLSVETAQAALEAKYPKMGNLVTAEYAFSDCTRFAYSQKISDWEIPFTEKSFTLKWDGTISAGIDLNSVSFSLNESGTILTVNIPQAEIFKFYVNDESYVLLNEKNNVFNPISVEDILDLDIDSEADMRQRAISNGLLEEAQKNARVWILDALRANADISTLYKIRFNMN